MKTTEITKEQIQTAIDFLETIPAENFSVGEQTKKFDRDNIGISHCVLGHLGVNPSSPFFDRNSINQFNPCVINDLDHFAHRLNSLVGKFLDAKLHHIHNGYDPLFDKIKESTPKGRSIKALQLVMEKL